MIKLSLLFTPLLLITSNITPIPLNVNYDKDKAELGKKLFFDPTLSKDNTVACSSCHTLPGSGANNISFSLGANKVEGKLNSPTVLNSAYNFRQFWNGKSKNLKEQALEPITDPLKMASKLKDVIKKLKGSKYRREFIKIYKDGVTQDNLADAIAEFEKALITPNSKFDKYLRGDDNAISKQEKRGYKAFKDLGCVNCHNGINVGGNMYQTIGIIEPYKQLKEVNGRYDITKRQRDKNVFKVPSLRNIELTKPYFHDGQISTLKEAIEQMQILQLGIKPNKDDTKDIKAFLITLTGETPKIFSNIK